jgi:hypothetical protein
VRVSHPAGVDVDQREVGRAAADVEHEHTLAGRELRAGGGLPLPARDPRVERRLRLLEEDDRRVAGARRGLQRQLARCFVERGRHGDEHFLLVERVVGMRVIPCRTHVREDECLRGHR